jgi:hypothetical protein
MKNLYFYIFMVVVWNSILSELNFKFGPGQFFFTFIYLFVLKKQHAA